MASNEFNGGSTVFLVTNTFPYGKGEEFIEAEIDHLAHAFDSVAIIATQTQPDATLTRAVPHNCIVLRAGAPRPTGKAALTTITKGLVSRLRAGLKGLPRKPSELAMEFMFEGRAQDSMRKLLPQLPAVGLDAEGLPKITHAVVYSYWLHVTGRVALLLADWLTRHGVPVETILSRAHRYDLYPMVDNRGFLPERELLLSGMDRIHPVSDMGTAFLQQSFPAFASKISTHRLGSADPQQVVECRQDPAHVVSCSYVVSVKRVERFPKIIEAASKQLGREVEWTHFGSGDGLAKVEQATVAQRQAGQIHLEGYVPNTELDQRYRKLRPSVFMNLSASEGVPVSIMEVIALGIPVIATDVGGVSEIVIDGHNGYLLPEDFTDAQAEEALLKILRLPEDEYQLMCQHARELWMERYDQQKNYPQFVAEIV